jgi:hypothetical protein
MESSMDLASSGEGPTEDQSEDAESVIARNTEYSLSNNGPFNVAVAIATKVPPNLKVAAMGKNHCS